MAPSFFCVIFLATLEPSLHAQLVVKLSPQTVNEFEHYAHDVEATLQERWSGKKDFLFIEDDPATKERVLGGELFIKQMNNGRPVEITNGLIHDWLGAIYMPNTSIERVLAVLEDFDRHKDIYPSITRSRTISRQANNIKGYWRLQQKGLVPVILDVEEDVHYSEIAPGKWKGQNYARNITEVDTSWFSRGRKFPAGEGHGFLWRLYGYWSLEAYRGGVLAECRTLSLSRDIPPGLGWAVTPYVQKMPQDSLAATLKDTKKAAAAK